MSEAVYGLRCGRVHGWGCQIRGWGLSGDAAGMGCHRLIQIEMVVLVVSEFPRVYGSWCSGYCDT